LKTKEFIYLVLISSIIFLFGCSSTPRYTTKEEADKHKNENNKEEELENSEKSKTSFTQEGLDSFYGDEFHGKRTANGEIFDKNKLSAAHRTLPLGTIAMVTNLKNDKKVRVRINDRGPFVSGRILDVSQRAAQELDFIKEGTTRIRLEVIKLGDNQYNK
jgi:rare lipoprotein A